VDLAVQGVVIYRGSFRALITATDVASAVVLGSSASRHRPATTAAGLVAACATCGPRGAATGVAATTRARTSGLGQCVRCAERQHECENL
jgi:hypothetical protein